MLPPLEINTNMETSLNEKLSAIQIGLKAPKSKYNAFGKYKYRSLEDVMEAVKPLLNGLTLVCSDGVEAVQGHVVVSSTATISDGITSITSTAYAGVEKAGGMQLPQAYGSASTYARKKALDGLFCLDDTKDADDLNTHQPTQKQPVKEKKAAKKEVIGPTPKSTRKALVEAGWDGKTIREGSDGTPFVETTKAIVKLTPDQATQLKSAA